VTSFLSKFPTFSLGKSWMSLLYGHSEATLAPITPGHPSVESHSSLNHLEIALSETGEATFGNTNWKVSLAPLGFSLTAPKLYRRDGLQLLRSDDAEIGFSRDKDTTRHFFLFGKSAPAILQLKLGQHAGSTKLEYNPELGYLAFTDQDDKLIFVYSSPVARLPSNETVTLPIEWDGENSAVTVKLPDVTPIVVSFGVAAKLPTSKRDFLSLLFPWFKFGESGTVEDEEPHKSKVSDKGKKPSFNFPPKSNSPVPAKSASPVPEKRSPNLPSGLKVMLPTFAQKSSLFDLGRTWISNLYGTAENPLKPITEESARHKHPALNKIEASLSPTGETAFNAPDWKAKFVPNFSITNPKLFVGDGVHVVRGDDGEIGLSYDKLSSRHFFFYGQQPADKFVLTFSIVEGSARVEYNKEKQSVAFLDGSGKVRLVYSAPTAKLSNNQTVTVSLDWDASTSSIVIVLPEPNTPPLVLALAVGLKYTELKGEKHRGLPRISTPDIDTKLKEEPTKVVHGRGASGSLSGVKYHNFKLERNWLADLYGGSDVPLTPTSGKLPKQTHHALPNIDVALAGDGSVEYGAGDWKFKLSPINFVPVPSVPHRGDGVQLLRGEDGEIGLYHDKNASRHFFIVGRAPPTTKFGLKLAQLNGNTKVEFSKEKGYVAFSDSTSKHRLVYSAPRVQTGSGKTTNPPLDWDNQSSTLSISLPDLNLPLVIMFHLGVKITLGPKFRPARPGSGTYEAIDPKAHDENGNPKAKTALPAFLKKFPNFKLLRPWHEAIYGPNDVALTQIPSKSPQPIPALNGLEVGLSPSGDADFGSTDWKIKLAPVSFRLAAAKLHKGDGLQVVRADDNEVGISYDEHSFRHYFFFGKAPVAQKFTLKLTPLSGSVKVDLNKEKGVVTFSDHAGKLKFVYTSPVILLASGKTVPVNVDWEGPSSSLFVLLPDTSFPMILAFGISGKVPESKEKSRNISFPSFKFGTAGNIEVPADEEKEGELQKLPRRTTTTTTSTTASDKAKQFGFSFNLSKPKVSLPSFSAHFPKFKIGKSWSKTLYGRAGALSPVPEGQALRISYPSLPHFEVGLSTTGEVHFGSGEFKLTASPISFHITEPKLLKSDGLQLLRGEDGEVGFSVDESSSRHFFILGKAPSSTKFSIKLTGSGAQVDYNKDRGYVAFSKGPVSLVYYAPVALLPTNITKTLPLDWDAHSETLSIVLPDLSFPVIVAFGVGTKIPDAHAKPGFSFPSLKFRSTGERDDDSSSSSSSSSDDEDEKPKRKPIAKESFPASFQKGIPSPLIAETLYGHSPAALTDIPADQVAVLPHPSLGLDVGLNSAGEIEFGTPTFKVKLRPNITLTSPKLLKRDDLQVLRAADGEIGVSFGPEGPSRHFFILGKPAPGNRLSLALVALAGGVKLKFDKHSIEVSDQGDKVQFVYLSPIAQYGKKTITLPLEWDAASNSLFVTLPDSASYPVLVAFGVSNKILEGTARWSVVFPSLRGHVSRTGEVDERPEEHPDKRKKLVLPSFFSNFSPAKFLKWIATLYGPNIKADSLVEPPAGETSLSASLPSLGLSVSLNEDGEVEFSAPEWKGKFFPEETIRFGKLLSHEGLQLLRHKDGEIGVSYDKNSIRYFFILNSPKEVFRVNFEQVDGATKLEFFEDKGLLSFAYESGKVILVISSPLLLSGDRTHTTLLTWDGSISVPIPPETKFPAVLTFGISAVAPDPQTGFEAFFPDIKIGEGGIVEEEDSDDSDEEKQGEVSQSPTLSPSPSEEKSAPSETGLELGKFEFSSRYPAFKLDAPWVKALYGEGRSHALSTIPQGQASIFFHPYLGNLKVALNYHGEVTFQDVDWQLSVSTVTPIVSEATLIEREGLQVLRNELGELGLSFDKKSSRFFIILGASPASNALSLHFKIDAGTKVVKERGLVVFQDKAGKPRLVFASPVGHIASNQNFTFPIEWDSSSHVINVILPHDNAVPVAFAFALYHSPPPEKEVKKGNKWGLGSAISAVTSSVSSVLGYYPEGWEPAVPGIDAPLYEYPKIPAPVSYPTSSPSTPAAPAKGQSSDASAANLGTVAQTEGNFAVGEPEPWEFEQVKVQPRLEPIDHDIIELEVDTPLAKNGVTIHVDSGSSSSSSSSSSEGEDEEKSKQRKERREKRRAEKGPKKGKAASTANIEKAPHEKKDEHVTEEAEQVKAEHGKAEHERGDREKAEREKVEKEDREKADKAERDRAEHEKAEHEKAEREKADREKAERERVEKEKTEHEKLEHEKAEREKAEHDKAEHAKAEHAKAEHDKAEHDKAEHDKAEHEKAEHEKAEHAKAEHAKAEHEKAEREKTEREKAEHDKAEREKAEHEKAEREKTEREEAKRKAEREKELKEKEAKDKKEKKDKAKETKQKAAKDREEKEKEAKEHRAKELAKLGPLPSATFDRGFRGALYGKADLENFVHEAPATSLYSATTNLTFAIGTLDGVLTIGPAQGTAWLVRVVPVGLAWDAQNAKLFKGSAFVSVRCPGIEIGAQVREDSSSQFFVLANGGPLVLRFETSGIGEIKYDEKDGETLFCDTNGKSLFIYSTPALHARSKSKKIRSNISWDGNSKELRIESLNYTESLGIVCAICTKCITLPPDDVLYSLPDGSFVVVHPKVNFMGYASRAGIAYKSLTPEADPWSITLALQGGKVHKVYAQSKCTVVVLRDHGIREYLAYVDRGEDYVGLHQSFHLYNPPSSYPLRIPVALALENITEVAETSDSVITFSTKNGPVFAYGNVTVMDARGNSIASRIHLENAESDRPTIVVEVLEEGEFPLVVG
jgi:hypothetical protein